MTTHFEIIRSWMLSCEKEEQLMNLKEFVNLRLITDEKQRDDIIVMLVDNDKRRDFVRSKQAMRFPADDEQQPTDIV